MKNSHHGIRSLVGITALVILCMLVSFVGCTSQAKAPVSTEPIKIGVLQVMTGLFSQFGVENVNGAKLAVIGHPTVMGRPVQLIVEDTEGKPDVCITKAQKLVLQDKVVALLSVFGSGEALALRGAADKLGVPIMLDNPKSDASPAGHRLVFRSGTISDTQCVNVLIQGIGGDPTLKSKSWYVLGHDYEWGRNSGKVFIEKMKAIGVNIVGEDYAPTNTTDWSTFLNKVKASGATALYTPVVPTVSGDLAKQAYQFGILPAATLCFATPLAEIYVEQVGEPCLGAVAPTVYHWSLFNTPEAKTFNDLHWNNLHLIPALAACQTYVGANILFKAMETANSTDTDKVVAALNGMSYVTPYGQVTIRPSDHECTTPAVFMQFIKADTNPYGAKYAAKTVVAVPPDKVGP